MRKMNRTQKVITVLLYVAIITFVMIGAAKAIKKIAKETIDTTMKYVSSNEAVETIAVQSEPEEASDAIDSDTVISEEIVVATEPTDEEDSENADEAVEVSRNMAGAKPENATGEDGWITDVTDEDIQIFNNAFPALTAHTANKIIDDYNSQFGYEKWPDGTYKVEFSWNSMTESDFERQKSAVWAGLSKKEINDALDKVFESLTEDDIKALLKLTFGKSIDLDNPEQIKLELFKTWLENPVAFEAWLNFIQDLKVGESGTLSENCPGLREYLSENQAARQKGGAGIMIRLRDEEGHIGMAIQDVDHLYVNQSHITAVAQMISFFEPLEVGAGRYHIQRSYHLVGLDYNHLRVATETKEDEPDIDYWLTFSYYLKGGKKAFFVGANLADRRPGEIKNTSVSKKPAPKPKPTPAPVKQQQTITTQTINIGGYMFTIPTGGGGGGGNNPTPTPVPTPEYKAPSQDPAWNGNAPVGGGLKSDPGPGTWKEDQGNSKSDTVPGSQYQPGTSENPTPPASSYDPGPSADHSDNAAPPETKPIEEHESHYSDGGGSSDGGGDSGGESKDAGDDNGSMDSAPPAED